MGVHLRAAVHVIRNAERWRRAFVAVVSGVLLASCSSHSGSADPNSTRASAISSAQASELAKSHVTFDDYQSAFRRYQACMSQVGFTVAVLSLANQVYDYRLPATTSSDPRALRCYSYEFEQVDERWQIQNEDTSPTADLYRQCLGKHGLPTTGPMATLQKEITSAGLDALRC